MLNYLIKIKLFLVVCVIASIFVGFILGIWAQYYGSNKTYCVYLDKRSTNYCFSIEDVYNLQSKYPAMQITYEAMGATEIKANHHICNSTVIETNEEYSDLYRMSFIYGSFWPRKMYRKSVVISKSLAWELFGNINVIGEYLELFGEKYWVCGVAQSGEGQLTAWVKGKQVQEGHNERLMPSIYVRNIADEGFQAKQEIQQALEWLGKNDGCRIVDIGQYADSIMLRPVFLITVCFAWAAYKILRNIIMITLRYIQKAKLNMKDYYLRQYIKEKKLSIVKEIFFIAIHFVVFSWLVQNIQWEVLLDTNIWDNITMNSVTAFCFAELQTLNIFSYVNFLAGILASLGLSVKVILSKKRLKIF